MELFIDTTEREVIKLALLDGKKVIVQRRKHTREISENLLSEIAGLLKSKKMRLSDLEKISVNPGPGGFASTRSGVATANALAYALGILKKTVSPKYDKEPNITKPRRLSS